MNVSLGCWTKSNVAARVPVLNDPAVYRFLAPGLPVPYTLQHSLDFLAFCRRNGLLEYAVLVDGEVVGGIGAHPVEAEGTWETGYYLARKFWRRGVMSRAIPLFLAEVSKSVQGLQRVIARVYDFNEPSMALLSRCGFRRTSGLLMERARDGLEHRLFHFEYTFS